MVKYDSRSMSESMKPMYVKISHNVKSVKISLTVQYHDVTINQHGGRPPFWKWLYLHISTANRPNLTKCGTQTQILTKATERWQKFRNSQIQDGGRTPCWKLFFSYNSAPYCPIKTKFGVRSHNSTHMKVRWWNVQFRKSNMVDGRHFENHISNSPYLSRK